MLITLTPIQWKDLKALVIQGKRSEVTLGLPVELVNGDQDIEITEDETKITLND